MILEKSYKINNELVEVFIESDDFNKLNAFLNSKNYHKIILLADENTLKHCLPIIDQNYCMLHKAEIIEVDPQESSKSLEYCVQIFNTLQELQVNKDCLIVNLGGGVICDLGGFIASIYKRGIDCIHLPTTLLSMIDASIGSKTAINLNDQKNQIGSFYNAKAVFVHPIFLQSLSERTLKSAFGEILKYALIHDIDLFDSISKTPINRTDLTELIATCIDIKIHFIELDPFDQKERRFLNFGHTIGHALEAYFSSKTPIYHGEAVALGIVSEAYLSNKLGKLNAEELKLITETTLNKFNFKGVKFNASGVYKHALQDKKNDKTGIKCALIKGIGIKDRLETINKEDLLESLEYLKSMLDK